MNKNPSPIKNKACSFLDVFRFAAHYWLKQPWKLTIILSTVAISSLLETYLPTALSAFFGAIRAHADHSVIAFALMVFLGVYFLEIFIFSLSCFIYNFFETQLFKSLMDDAFAHVHRLSEHFFVNTFTGSLVSIINRARYRIEIFEDQILFRIFSTVIVLVGSILFLAWHFPLLAILLACYVGILSTISALLVFKMSGPAQGIYAEIQDHVTAHLADSIGGIATSKSYAAEQTEVTRFCNLTTQLRQKNLHAYLLGNLTGWIQRVLLLGMLAILLAGGMWYLFQGKASIEDMAYLVLAYSIMQFYIRDLSENIKNLLTSSYDLHGIVRLMREPPEEPERACSQKKALNIQKGAIEFDQVTFTYPDKTMPIFKNFSVAIQAGERVALVGHSGSGKTSFIRLLQYLYPAQSGRILIDGQDIANGTLFSLRSAISLVPQDPILFHRTLRENIAYGKPNASLNEVRMAAAQAHIGEFIEALPERYNTLVGERGIKLSGGERQRIAIARAILADRPILILDEATSSLDSVSERAIQEALSFLTHGRTSIMIAHRLSTILEADRIFVFDQGKIVEEGTHDDLILKNGTYAGFFKLQSANMGSARLLSD